MAQPQADAAEIGRRAAEEALGSARQGAHRFGAQMREAAQSMLDEQKIRVADAVHGLADAFRRAADTLEQEQNRTVARYADQAAAQIDRLSASVRARDVADLLAEAEDFARRQPSLFFAGAVAAGFVIGRLIARPGDGGGAARGYAMTGGEHAYHAGEPQPGEPLAGFGPVVAGAERR
ncbi:MAG TPA: hypothetical protein VE397_15955 [Stellaceae bacterium]|jgi:ElaB/YqjD/DUF883 family membrane-anchored ribosome-binding protein|nr:hypothetical protein [Stellaceae bacterium]